MKTVCVYHSLDLDGWMSAAIVKHWFEHQGQPSNELIRTIDFIGYDYGQPIPDLSEYNKVIMCDISFPKDIMSDLEDRLMENFIWIDHHISAIKDSETLGYHGCKGIRNTKYAACELTWKHLMQGMNDNPDKESTNNKMPEIVRLLGLYDSFRHKNTDEEQNVLEFQYGARSIISNYEDAYYQLVLELKIESKHSIMDIYLAGKYIYQYLCQESKQSYKNGFEVGFHLWTKNPNITKDEIIIPSENEIGYHSYFKFICINKEGFNPINFNIDYHKDGYDGCVCFHRTKEGKWSFSLYSDKVDCSVIAKQYGGGGHFSASGFVIDDINKIIKS